MKAKAILSAAMISIMGTASPVLAAGAVREDHSGIVVWMFLGFCALIIIAQLVPAVLMMTGLIKGVAASREEAVENAAE
jgi:hypothetical protein